MTTPISHWSGNAAIVTGIAPTKASQFDSKTIDQTIADVIGHGTGGVLCNPSQVGGAPEVGPCYLPTTALSTTVPGSNGGQRQIEFALRLMF